MTAMEFLKSLSVQPCCGKLINGDAVRCYTCLNHEQQLQCLQCFKQEKHCDHKYVIVSADGQCGCGMTSSMKEGGFCDDHNGNNEPNIEQNNDNVACFAYLLLNSYMIMLRSNPEVAEMIEDLIDKLFFTYPIHTAQVIVTNVLFAPPQLDSYSSLIECTNDDIEFVDTSAMLQDYEENMEIQCPIICIFSQLSFVKLQNNLMTEKSRNHITDNLRDKLIQLPYFNTKMLQFWWLMSTKFFEETTLQFIDRQTEPQVLIPRWRNASVQITANMDLTEKQILLHCFTQLSNYFKSQLVVLGQYSENPETTLEISQTVLNDINQGLFELKSLGTDEKSMSFIQQKIYDILKYVNLAPSLSALQGKTQLTALMNYTLTELYSNKDISYAAIQLSNPLLCHIYSLAINIRASVSIIVLTGEEDDFTHRNTIIQATLLEAFESFIQQKYSTIYMASIMGTDLDECNQQSPQKLMSSIMDYSNMLNICPVRGQSVICNVATSSLITLLKNAQVHFSIQQEYNKHHDAPTGYGDHTVIPIKRDDQENDCFTFEIINANYGNLAVSLMGQKYHFDHNWSEITAAALLQRVLCQIDVSSRQNWSNLTILASISIRNLVTLGLQNSHMLSPDQQTQNIIRQFYQPSADFSRGQQPCYTFIVVQTLLQCVDATKFVEMFFEHYGFVNPTSNSFVDRVSKETGEKKVQMALLLSQSLKHLASLLFYDANIGGPKQLQEKLILQAFLNIQNPTQQRIIDYSNDQNLYSTLGIATIIDQLSNQIINTSFLELNQNGVDKMSIFDPFLNVSSSQFSTIIDNSKNGQYRFPLKLNEKPWFKQVCLQKFDQILRHKFVQQAIVLSMFNIKIGLLKMSIVNKLIMHYLFEQLKQLNITETFSFGEEYLTISKINAHDIFKHEIELINIINNQPLQQMSARKMNIPQICQLCRVNAIKNVHSVEPPSIVCNIFDDCRLLNLNHNPIPNQIQRNKYQSLYEDSVQIVIITCQHTIHQQHINNQQPQAIYCCTICKKQINLALPIVQGFYTRDQQILQSILLIYNIIDKNLHCTGVNLGLFLGFNKTQLQQHLDNALEAIHQNVDNARDDFTRAILFLVEIIHQNITRYFCLLKQDNYQVDQSVDDYKSLLNMCSAMALAAYFLYDFCQTDLGLTDDMFRCYLKSNDVPYFISQTACILLTEDGDSGLDPNGFEELEEQDEIDEDQEEIDEDENEKIEEMYGITPYQKLDLKTLNNILDLLQCSLFNRDLFNETQNAEHYYQAKLAQRNNMIYDFCKHFQHIYSQKRQSQNQVQVQTQKTFTETYFQHSHTDLIVVTMETECSVAYCEKPTFATRLQDGSAFCRKHFSAAALLSALHGDSCCMPQWFYIVPENISICCRNLNNTYYVHGPYIENNGIVTIAHNFMQALLKALKWCFGIPVVGRVFQSLDQFLVAHQYFGVLQQCCICEAEFGTAEELYQHMQAMHRME